MVSLRQAQRSDADAIAYLHAAGWRDTYGNVMSSDFPENYVQEERLSHWHSVLSQYSDDEAIFVAEKAGKVEGFIDIKLQTDDQWGNYIDSLHVSSVLRGQGEGKKLPSLTADFQPGRLVCLV